MKASIKDNLVLLLDTVNKAACWVLCVIHVQKLHKEMTLLL